jgi:hypothetical protein
MSAVAEARPEIATGTGWYVYGIVPGREEPPDLSEEPTVDPKHRIQVLVEGAVAAVVSRVGLSEFDEPSLSARLQDPVWLEAKIRAHEQVLEHVLSASSSVVPFRFCTIYRTEKALRDFLAEHGALLAETLRQVEGKVEIGVKAFGDPARFAQEAGAESETSDVAPGRAYLERRLSDQRRSEERARLASKIAERAHARLLSEAEAGVLLRVHSEDVSGRSDDMLLNGAYLVGAQSRGPSRVVDELRREFGTLGITFELSGPWPPYNFVPRELKPL